MGAFGRLRGVWMRYEGRRRESVGLRSGFGGGFEAGRCSWSRGGVAVVFGRLPW